MKILRVSTVPESLNVFCKGFLAELREDGYEVVVVSSPLKELAEIEKREKIKTVSVNIRRDIAPLNDLKSLYRLIKVFRKEKPDMVHSITPKAGLLSMMAAWFCRVPVRLHTFTGLVFPTSTGMKKRVLMLTDKITCFCATHINPEGEGVKNDLASCGITSKPLTILGNGNIKGVDSQYFNPENPEIENISKDSQVFTYLYVGRVLGDKGVNELVEAFQRLNAEYPSTELIIVGTIEAYQDPVKDSTLKAIHTNPAIKYMGFMHDVRPWYKSADALVLPSYREGFPNVVLEAGAMGLPAIVTDVNGSREIIEDKINGLIVPPKDADSLFKAMKFAVTNKEEWESMGDGTRKNILDRFEQSYVRQCLKDYYKAILTEHTT